MRSESSCSASAVFLPYTSEVDASTMVAPLSRAGLQHVLGAVQVDPQALQRLIEDGVHADRGGQVKDPVGVVDERVDQSTVAAPILP